MGTSAPNTADIVLSVTRFNCVDIRLSSNSNRDRELASINSNRIIGKAHLLGDSQLNYIHNF